MNVIVDWWNRRFSDPQLVLLVLVLLAALLVVIFLGDMLAPAIAAVIIAFLLDGPTGRLRRAGVANTLAVTIVFVVFVAIAFVTFVLFLPLIVEQMTQLVSLLPSMVARLQEALLKLPEQYPEMVDQKAISDLIDGLRAELLDLGQRAVEFSVSGLTGLVTVVVYAILVPLMVFFFLKDKRRILHWLGGFLPAKRKLVDQVWDEAVARTGDYARGKVYEIIIVGVVSWAVYTAIGLEFAGLLAVMTGLSVIVPYIGAAVVTFPVAFVAFFQWGITSDFFVAVIAYLVLQALDGNLLAPLLFSEVVKLHPNAIILAILIFGGIWGFWGVFFAIPLATLAHAVVKAWKDHAEKLPEEGVSQEV